jgi:phosphoserine phosphatase
MPDPKKSGRSIRRNDHVPSATATSHVTGPQFVEAVLRLEPSLVVFDCDGTLWAADSGADFFHWEIARGLLPPEVAVWATQRYDAYHAGDVTEEDICADMVTIHAGIRAATLERAAAEFFEEQVAPRIFPEMQELTSQLLSKRCDVWAVSSTNEWVVAAGVSRFGISRDRVLAACVEVVDGCATDRLIRVPTGEFKAVAIREVIGRRVDAAFGNSVHDAAMLALATHAFAIAPSAELEALAREQGWVVYVPVTAGERSG